MQALYLFHHKIKQLVTVAARFHSLGVLLLLGAVYFVTQPFRPIDPCNDASHASNVHQSLEAHLGNPVPDQEDLPEIRVEVGNLEGGLLLERPESLPEGSQEELDHPYLGNHQIQLEETLVALDHLHLLPDPLNRSVHPFLLVY